MKAGIIRCRLYVFSTCYQKLKGKSKKVSSEFVYIKKNNICYTNSNLNKSKNKSHFNINTFSNIINENNYVQSCQRETC